jgi:hypothetical protein
MQLYEIIRGPVRLYPFFSKGNTVKLQYDSTVRMLTCMLYNHLFDFSLFV